MALTQEREPGKARKAARAETKVSVRHLAEGARQVGAEPKGIGEAGETGFGALSSEMELTSRRLAGCACRAGIALAAVTAAAAAAGLAILGSRLAERDAQAQYRRGAIGSRRTPRQIVPVRFPCRRGRRLRSPGRF